MLKKDVEMLEPSQKLMTLCPGRPGCLLYEAEQLLKVIGSKYHQHFLVYHGVAAVAGTPQAMVPFAFAEYSLRPAPASPHIALSPRPLHPLGEELLIGLILGNKELPPLRGRAFLFNGAAAYPHPPGPRG